MLKHLRHCGGVWLVVCITSHEMDSAKAVDLRADRSLLDPKFEGYKLNLDPLPIYKVQLPKGPAQVKLREDQYSFQHVKAFGSANLLVLDTWNQNTVYYISSAWNIMKTTVEMESNLEKPTSVFQIPNASDLKLSPHQNVTMEFPADDWAIISDGSGGILLINTGKRNVSNEWKLCYSGKPLESEIEPVLLDSTLHEENGTYYCNFVLLHIQEKAKEENDASHFETVLDWITLSSADGLDWSVERTRQLTGTSSPDLVSLQVNGKGISISSPKPFTLKYDSVEPVPDDQEMKDKEDVKEPAMPAYTWYQSLEDLNIDFTLPEGITKKDIVYELKSDSISLSLVQGDNLLSGKLHALVDRNECTWTIEGKRLEIYLAKQTDEMWPDVVVGDERGEYVVNPEEAAKIHERLAHLTTDSLNSGEAEGRGLNAEDLEECDAFPDDTSVMIYLDAEKNTITHKTFLGIHQWLFNVRRTAGLPKAICLRHDVDGLLWQLKSNVAENGNPWEHTATFNALGFVSASKMEKKYASCAPNGSYSVICDCSRHFYVYRQTVPISSPLRNRITGEKVSAVAKQQVASLDCMDEFIGMQATNDRLFVLTDMILYVVRVDTHEII